MVSLGNKLSNFFPSIFNLEHDRCLCSPINIPPTWHLSPQVYVILFCQILLKIPLKTEVES